MTWPNIDDDQIVQVKPLWRRLIKPVGAVAIILTIIVSIVLVLWGYLPTSSAHSVASSIVNQSSNVTSALVDNVTTAAELVNATVVNSLFQNLTGNSTTAIEDEGPIFGEGGASSDENPFATGATGST